jgi:hypothetical protein
MLQLQSPLMGNSLSLREINAGAFVAAKKGL